MVRPVMLLTLSLLAPVWAQPPVTDAAKWPNYIDQELWPVFYQGAIESSKSLCLEVGPVGSAASLTIVWRWAQATQSRITIDQEIGQAGARPLSTGMHSSRVSPGEHIVTIAVRQPVANARIQAMVTNQSDGDTPELLKTCSTPSEATAKDGAGDAAERSTRSQTAASVTAPPDLPFPPVNWNHFGDPFSKSGILSHGTGSGSGIGSGKGGGVGSGNGAGVGPGEGGGFGGGVFTVGGGVTPPTLLQKVEPEYSEEARKAKHSGTVVLYIEVTTDGKAENIRVQRSLGLGLDEKAVEAVKKWRFSPGKKDGKPVRVAATIEVNFRLL